MNEKVRHLDCNAHCVHQKDDYLLPLLICHQTVVIDAEREA